MWGRGDFFVRMRSGGGISGLTGWNWAAMASKAPPLGWVTKAPSAGSTGSASRFSGLALENADADDTDEQAAELGKGAFGTTYKMQHKIDRRLYAVKMVSLRDFKRKGGNPAKLQDEARQLAQLDHPHIVRYFNCGEMKNATGKVFAIFMELLAGGSLFFHYTLYLYGSPCVRSASHACLPRPAKGRKSSA